MTRRNRPGAVRVGTAMASRRPARALLCSAAAAAALLAAACTAEPPGEPAPSTSAIGAPGTLPAGWRWESSGGIEVAVPAAWPSGESSQRLYQWCITEPADRVQPVVGRRGLTTQVSCSVPEGTTPGDTLLANTGPVVELGRTDQPDGVVREGDRTTVRLGGAEVVVQVPADLRSRIVDSIRRVEVDGNGCATTHPVSAETLWRPAPPVPLSRLTKVTAVSACKYELAGRVSEDSPRLLSGIRLTGPAAVAAIQGAAAAPVGGGPDRPGRCLPKYAPGAEGIVLEIESAAGRSEVTLRYSGCRHNGFDGGVTVRTLTAGSVAPFIAGANHAMDDLGWPKMARILRPGR
jgi:hypothetical protein